MYLRTSVQKRADGSVLTHFQIAESYWDRSLKRSKTRLLCSVGRSDDPDTTERLKRLVHSINKRVSSESLAPGWDIEFSWSYGAIYALEALWARLGIGEVIEELLAHRRFEFPVERALFALIANRALAPASKLYCFEQWLAEEVVIDGAKELALHHLYRAMDFLVEHQHALEKAIHERVSERLQLDVELIFYDTTSLHFEIDDNDEASDEACDDGSDDNDALRKRGHSKNGRSDAPQIVIGLAVTRDGFPVRHWIFPGNTVDVTTVAGVRADLVGWRLSRCVFVGDAGMVSEANLKTLAAGGGRYILCQPLGRDHKLANELLSRAGRYKPVGKELKIKEVVLGEGERRRRYVLCLNETERRRAEHHRQQVLTELEAELASLSSSSGSSHSKRVCALRSSRRYGRYLRQTKGGKLKISRSSVKSAARLDGKHAVFSNDDSLSAVDLAMGYRQLLRVERCWRDLKSHLGLRPVFHYAPHRIRAHVAISVLSLLLQRAAERACKDSWRNIRDDLNQIKLVQYTTPDGRFRQTSTIRENAQKRLKELDIQNPPFIASLG